MEKKLNESSGREIKRTPNIEPLHEIVHRVIENIERRNGKPEYPVGIEAIDKGTYGVHPSHLMVIAGRPGEGKSALAIQMAYNLAKQKKRVAYFSLEMTKECVLERLFCSLFDVTSNEVRMECNEKDLTAFKESILKKAIQFGSEIKDANLPLHIIDDWAHTEEEFFTLFEHLNYNPEVIFLDHLQEIRPANRQSKYDALDSYLRYMKLLAMQKKICCVIVSQINREGQTFPTLGNLKGCGSIEELSDEVFLCFQIKREELSQEEQRYIPYGKNFCMELAKNRFGATGDFYQYFNKPLFRFE